MYTLAMLVAVALLMLAPVLTAATLYEDQGVSLEGVAHDPPRRSHLPSRRSRRAAPR